MAWMNRACDIVLIFLVIAAGATIAVAESVAAPTTRPVDAAKAPPGWKLVWSDEFDGTAVDRTKWDFDRGSFLQARNEWLPGWGNEELEFYTGRPENVYLKDGMLHLRAVREPFKGASFTSARLKTRSLFAKRYGRFEFRAKLPTSKGIWPAIWMRPQDDKYGDWAASGEIDIMEARGQEPNKVLGTLHHGSKWPANIHSGADFLFPAGQTFADFHVYTLEWKPGAIRWLVDDSVYQAQNFWWSSSETDGPRGVEPASAAEVNPWPAPFDQPYYLILNVAVGGVFLGNPDASTIFPAEMVVDYVRVYDPVEGYGPTPPRGAGKLPFEKR